MIIGFRRKWQEAFYSTGTTLELSVTEAASRLATSRVALSRVLNGEAAISTDLAVRLEQAGASTARA